MSMSLPANSSAIKDHTYCAPPQSTDSETHEAAIGDTTTMVPTPICASTPRKVESASTAIPVCTTLPRTVSFPCTAGSDSEDGSETVIGEVSSMTLSAEAQDNDVSWNPNIEHSLADTSEVAETSDCESESEPEQGYRAFLTSSKYIVFEECLESLINSTVCSMCRCPVSSYRKVVVGCNVVYHIQYSCHHEERTWSANPFLRSGRTKFAVGNVLVCAATLFSGLTYARLESFCKIFNLATVSRSTFYDTQQQVLIPVINQKWAEEKELLQGALRDSQESLILAGDGRCDSPGFSAKYCNYSFMNLSDNRIVDFELVQVTQSGSSQGMEKYGFSKTLDRLIGKGLKVKSVVTDRHVGIRSLMKKEYAAKGVDHQFDVYHIANSFRKKLTELTKKKRHADLVPWVKSIVNHVWYSSRNCNGNSDKLVELFTSICFHVAARHRWTGYHHVTSCLHLPYTAKKQKQTKWLKGTSLQALKNIVFEPRLLHDIRQLSLFCHTGRLECFHSSLLVFCPKRQEFDFPCMLARSQLAVMHHNANVGRSQAVNTVSRPGCTGEGELRFKPEWKKQSGAWRARPVYEPTTSDHVHDMVATVLQVKSERKCLPQVERPAAKNIAKTPAPSKEHLINHHVDRFK